MDLTRWFASFQGNEQECVHFLLVNAKLLAIDFGQVHGGPFEGWLDKRIKEIGAPWTEDVGDRWRWAAHGLIIF